MLLFNCCDSELNVQGQIIHSKSQDHVVMTGTAPSGSALWASIQEKYVLFRVDDRRQYITGDIETCQILPPSKDITRI